MTNPIWRPIADAPTDGTTIIGLTKVGSVVLMYCDDSPCESGTGDDACLGWTALKDGEHPPCWTDGICWASNEDGEASDPPTHWMPFVKP